MNLAGLQHLHALHCRLQREDTQDTRRRIRQLGIFFTGKLTTDQRVEVEVLSLILMSQSPAHSLVLDLIIMLEEAARD
jgi:hypothetical protein